MLFVAPMPGASVEKFTGSLAVPCAASPCVSAGAISKRLVAFREAASFQGQTPRLEERAGEAARLPWHYVGWSALISVVFKTVVGLLLTGFRARGTPSEWRKRVSTPSH